MNHNFDIDLAKEYGVDIAIVINNLAFWIQKNKANNKHIHEGKVWTYNSTKAFSKIFPYWTENQMRRILSNMEEKGIIETGNYNQMQYNRTKWYAFTDAFLQNHKCICEFTQMDSCKPTNGFVQTNEPIPDNKPFHKPVEKPDRESKRFCKPSLQEVEEYCKERNNGINAQKFISFYDAKGWMIGKNKMVDWKGAVRTWEQRDKADSKKSKPKMGDADYYANDSQW